MTTNKVQSGLMQLVSSHLPNFNIDEIQEKALSVTNELRHVFAGLRDEVRANNALTVDMSNRLSCLETNMAKFAAMTSDALNQMHLRIRTMEAAGIDLTELPPQDFSNNNEEN